MPFLSDEVYSDLCLLQEETTNKEVINMYEKAIFIINPQIQNSKIDSKNEQRQFVNHLTL